MATKLRALCQRRKGRDLYDLWLALETLAPDEKRVVAGLRAYLKHGGLSVSRAQYEANMTQKLASADFRKDVMPLLRDESSYDIDKAYRLVHERLIARIPGEPWKGLPQSAVAWNSCCARRTTRRRETRRNLQTSLQRTGHNGSAPPFRVLWRNALFAAGKAASDTT